MARPDHLFVFAYDVARDTDRRKLAEHLENHADRVQFSVFEGRMTVKEARRVGEAALVHLGPADSLRVYCVTEEGRGNSMVFGAGVLPEADDFLLA